MERLSTWFIWALWFFRGKIPTAKQAMEMGLTHETNVHGDLIILSGYCRSYWKDAYGRSFSCEELYKGGKDVVKKELPIQNLKPNI